MVPCIKGAIVTIGCVKKLTTGKDNKPKIKYRVTHDASFTQLSGASVNDLCDTNILPESKFGFSMLRILHGIHSMRREFPEAAIVIAKYDFDGAYRRIPVHPDMVVKIITVVGGVVYLLNRVPFVVNLNSFLFGGTSEPVFDLTTRLLQDPSWDPVVLNNDTLSDHFKPIKPSRVGPLSYFPRPLLVDIPKREVFADGFIDDVMSFGLVSHLLMIQHAAPLVSHTVFCPPAAVKHVERTNVSSLKKLATEGHPETLKVVLRCLIDMHSFKMKLEKKKGAYWRDMIMGVLREDAVETKPLESLIGRLTNVSYLIPLI